MMMTRRRMMVLITAFVLLWAWGGAALAAGSYYDQAVYREYRAAKRQQAGDLCSIWLPSWRPGTVGQTYINLGNECAQIDTSKCGDAIRQLIGKAERTWTEIGELFGHGAIPDTEILLPGLYGGIGVKFPSAALGAKEARIFELMSELRDFEESVARDLELGP